MMMSGAYSTALSQNTADAVCHLRHRFLFLPVRDHPPGWGLLHHQRCQGAAQRIQDHHLRPLHQWNGNVLCHLSGKVDSSFFWFSDADFASSCQFVFLTYILGVAWLGVFGFSAVPVFLFYNMWSTCATMRSPMANITNIDSICVDVRQYGRRKTLVLMALSLLIWW